MGNHAGEPTLSVIVPAHRATGHLPRSLGALLASDLLRERWELIVVDDASGDATAPVAARHADLVVRLGGLAGGPALARNRGAEMARGRYLVFVDADVCVHPDALRLIVKTFEHRPELGAVFGSYDATPGRGGLVSDYRNLLHHYVHHRDPGEAATFWAGLGAVRADVFTGLGGFDERRYPRPQIEDIELGYRIRRLGANIESRPEIQGTHLKRWTLRGGIVTDVRDRGIPWMRLVLGGERPGGSGTLNLRAAEKAYTAATALAGIALLGALVTGRTLWLVAAVGGLAGVIAGNWPLIAWFGRQRGWWFAARTVPLRLLYYALNVVSAAVATALHLSARKPSAPGGSQLCVV